MQRSLRFLQKEDEVTYRQEAYGWFVWNSDLNIRTAWMHRFPYSVQALLLSKSLQFATAKELGCSGPQASGPMHGMGNRVWGWDP